MKRIALTLFLISLFCFTTNQLNAQPEDAMKRAETSITNQLAADGFSHSQTIVFTAEEIAMGATVTLFPGNLYAVVVSTDGIRHTGLLVKGNPMLFAVREQLEEMNKTFKGTMPAEFTEERVGGFVAAEVDLQTVGMPIDYDINLGMSKSDIKSDTKLNLIIYYKSTDQMKGNMDKNNPENHYAELWKNQYSKTSTPTDPATDKLNTYKEIITKDAAQYGYSLANYINFKVVDFPIKEEMTLYEGNEYLLVLHSTDTKNIQLKGKPEETFITMSRLTENMDYMKTFTAEASTNQSVQQLDFRKSEYSVEYKLDLEGRKDESIDDPVASLFIFYKNRDNNTNNPEANKGEKYYSQKSTEEFVARIQSQERAKANAVIAKHEYMNLEDMDKEVETLTPISPSGLKYMNGKIAMDKWMEALVRESRGDDGIYKTFDAMHEDWQNEHSAYKANSTADKLLNELEGGFTHRGFTKDNLLVVDHIIGEKIVARYYFKIKKCKDYGRIIPRHRIKDGQLHIMPWQKAMVPRS